MRSFIFRRGMVSAQAFICLLFFFVTAGAQASSLRLQLKLGLGGGRLNLDEISQVIRDGEAQAANWAVGGTMVEGSGIPEPGPVYDAHAELLAFFSSRWALGVEVGMSGNTKQGQVGWAGAAPLSVRHAVEARYTVVPIRLSARYFLGRSGRVRAYAQAGAGLYPGRIYLQQRTLERSLIPDRFTLFSAQARGTCLGLHGGGGLTIPLTRRLGLFVDVIGQFARIASMKGEGVVKDADMTDGSLIEGFFWTVTAAGGEWAGKKLLIAAEPPADAAGIEAEKLHMNLSGWSMRAGIIIRL